MRARLRRIPGRWTTALAFCLAAATSTIGSAAETPGHLPTGSAYVVQPPVLHLFAHFEQPPVEETDQPEAATEAHRQLQRILDQPLYQRWKRRHRSYDDAITDSPDSAWGRALAEWIADVAETLGRWLDKWFHWEGPRVRGPSTGGGMAEALKLFGYFALGILVFSLVGFVYQALRGARLHGGVARVLSRAQVDAALEAGAALALASPQWLLEADRLAQQGDLRAMYRALYLALLSGLHRRGKIDFRKTRTNWTYVSRYRGPAAERDRFADLTAGFDVSWYGGKTPPRAQLDGVRAEIIALLGQES